MMLRQWNWTTIRFVYITREKPWSHVVFPPEAILMQARNKGVTSGGKAEAREGSGRLRGLALSHRAGHHPNNRSPDWRSAQSPKSTALQIVKLWASIGLGAAAKVTDNGEWFGQGYPPWPGWPITACQMWQHQQSPTSNHTAAAFLESLGFEG